MGTDIHMIAEVRKDGVWQTILDDIFVDWEGTKFERQTCVPYSDRNYNLFAILADVRNGTGFAGLRRGERFNPISEPKGYPEDMCKDSEEFLSYEHSASWLTLKEIFDFNWAQIHRDFGVVSEQEYRDHVMKGEMPHCWCGDISGTNYIKISENEMVDLIQGKYPRQEDIHYYTSCYFAPQTYADSAQHFLKNMNILKKFVPENGTLEDVRIVFDFDS